MLAISSPQEWKKNSLGGEIEWNEDDDRQSYAVKVDWFSDE